jgi:hypothetical protein
VPLAVLIGTKELPLEFVMLIVNLAFMTQKTTSVSEP